MANQSTKTAGKTTNPQRLAPLNIASKNNDQSKTNTDLQMESAKKDRV